MQNLKLKQDLLNLAKDIERQIKVIVDDAAKFNAGVPAIRMRDMNGNYILVPLLLAKSQVLAALVNLKE